MLRIDHVAAILHGMRRRRSAPVPRASRAVTVHAAESEATLLRGIEKAVASEMRRMHAAGIATTHAEGGDIVRIDPDGTRRVVGTLRR